MPIRAIKGTKDILPGEVEVWQLVEEQARRTFALYGYGEIRTPIFEATDLFQKATGSDTDIVTKEMYTFTDRGERSLTLRPEGTPGVVRAAIERGLVRGGDTERLYYIGPMFRYERPQKGRYRQFSQIGVEALGCAEPALDAEVMQMVLAYFAGLGIDDAALRVNSVGHGSEPGRCRNAYREALKAALLPRREELCPDCQRRLDTNPLRILDCKVPGCAAIRAVAPSILEFLCEDCAGHMTRVKDGLSAMEVPYEVDPTLVRGLDYYTRTTFEVSSGRLGAQNALCGGGRYDDLVASMGGPATPAIGFAIGSDRLVLVVSEMQAGKERMPGPRVPDLFVVHLGDAALTRGLAAAKALRQRGLHVRLDPEPRDVRKQMSRASAAGARYALIIGEREMEREAYTLKRMSDGVQSETPSGDWDRIYGEVVDGGR